MPRPPMPLGTYGKIKVNQVAPGRFRARCKYRHYDGKVYQVQRDAGSETAAVNRLKEAIRDWVTPAQAGVRAGQPFREVALGWLAEFERDADRGFNSWGSVDTYRNRLTSDRPAGDRRATGAGDRGVAGGARPGVPTNAGRDERQFGQDREVGHRERVHVRRPGRRVRDQPCPRHRPHRAKKARNKRSSPRALTTAEVFDLLGKLDTRRGGRGRRPAGPGAVLPRHRGADRGSAGARDWEDFDVEPSSSRMAGNVIRAKGKGRIDQPRARRRTPSGTSRSPTGAWTC